MAFDGYMSGLGGAYNLGTASAANFIPEIWSPMVKYERDKALMMARYIKQIDFRGTKMDTLYIPLISGVAVDTKVAETPRQYQIHTDSTYVIEVDTHRQSAFMTEDIVELQSTVDHVVEYSRQHGYAMGLDLECYLLAARADLQGDAEQVIYNTADWTSTGAYKPLSEPAILAAKNVLDRRRVPRQGRLFFHSSSQHNHLLTIDRFANNAYNGDIADLRTGMITGQAYGFTFILLDTLTENTDTDHYFSANQNPGDAYSPGFSTSNGTWQLTQQVNTPVGLGTVNDGGDTAIACGPEFLALAMQRDVRVEQERSMDYMADKVGWDYLFGMKLYREKEAVLVHTA